MKTIILILLLFNQISLACGPVTYLRSGQSSPCDGYLFTPEKERQVREMSIKYGDMEKLVNKQDELVKTLEQRTDILTQQNTNLRNQMNATETRSSLEKSIYFALGIVLGLGMGKVFNK